VRVQRMVCALQNLYPRVKQVMKDPRDPLLGSFLGKNLEDRRVESHLVPLELLQPRQLHYAFGAVFTDVA
jgi:hypothetical protein